MFELNWGNTTSGMNVSSSDINQLSCNLITLFLEKKKKTTTDCVGGENEKAAFKFISTSAITIRN